jgi:DEP domain-containing protein 5
VSPFFFNFGDPWFFQRSDERSPPKGINFHKNVLLMHYSKVNKLSGHLSAAHNGNILEAVNLAINAFEHHYVDRDLQRTGLSVVFITAGTCQFQVNKALLRLTTERMIDLGVTVDCVSLAKVPLHQVPLFRFTSADPSLASEASLSPRASLDKPVSSADVPDHHSRSRKPPPESLEPLYYDGGQQEESTFFIVPAWVDSSFYSRQPDRPFRVDRFMPRCKMPQIQSLGVDEHENATFSIPLLQDELKITEEEDRRWAHLSDKERRKLVRERYGELAVGNRNALGTTTRSARKRGQRLDSLKDGGSSMSDKSESSEDDGRGKARGSDRSVRKQPSTTSEGGQTSSLSLGRPPSSILRSTPSTSSFRTPSLATSTASTTQAASSPKSAFTPALLSRIAAQAQVTTKDKSSKSWFWSLRAGSHKTEAAPAQMSYPKSDAAVGAVDDLPSLVPLSSTRSSSRSPSRLKADPTPSPSSATSSPLLRPTAESDPTMTASVLSVQSQSVPLQQRVSPALTTLGASHLGGSVALSDSPEPSVTLEDRQRFNPSNPKRNRELLLGQVKRWQNIFSRRAADQRSVKWR